MHLGAAAPMRWWAPTATGIALVLAGLAQAGALAWPGHGAPLWWLHILSLAGFIALLQRSPSASSALLRSATFATAESLTGGSVCAALVDVPGASAVVRGGVVSYHRDVKVALLGVDPERLATHGAVDRQVAAQMAAGARAATGADLAVATTGVAGPEPHDGQPVGTVWIGIAGPAGTRAVLHRFAGDRDAVRAAAREAALAALLAAVEES